jgi:hypothetical protein
MHEDARFQTWSEQAFVLRGQMVGHGGYDGPPGNNASPGARRRRVRLRASALRRHAT